MSLDILSGISPSIRLYARSSLSSDVRFPKEAGNFPVRAFLRRDRRTREESEASSEGISCSRLLEDRSLVKSAEQLDKPSGIPPPRTLFLRFKLKPEQLPHLRRDATVERVVCETMRCDEREVTDKGRDNTC